MCVSLVWAIRLCMREKEETSMKYDKNADFFQSRT